MKVYELLDKPEKWTKRAYARDVRGNSCSIHKGECWCLMGALDYCYPSADDYENAYIKIRDRLQDYFSLPAFNDNESTTYEDVISLVRELDI
jgi:hypothetical protein